MRNCGWWPGSFGLAQWQLGFPQRRTLAVMEPGRKSPKRRNCSRSFARSSSKSGRDSGTRHSGILSLQCLRVKLLSEICPKKEKPAINYSYVVHPLRVRSLNSVKLTAYNDIPNFAARPDTSEVLPVP